MEEIFDWLKLAERFASDGEAQSMFGAANEILVLDKNSAAGYVVKAEAHLYLGELEKAETFARKSLQLEPENLRGRLILGGVAAENFQLFDEFKIFNGVIEDCRKLAGNFFAERILFKALCWLSNGLYLAGEAQRAAGVLREASGLTENLERAAELFSKHLFFLNYNGAVKKSVAQEFNRFFDVRPYTHAPKISAGKLRLGYISPDFRQHAVANFVTPLLKDFDAENFSVTVYHTGKSDSVTAKLKRGKISWRDLNGVDARTAAEIIRGDELDILVDLSGHSQNSCLPILAYKPAPLQITAIGYVSTTGLQAVDYFLSDKISGVDESNFTEKLLLVDGCHLCYSPILEMPAAKHTENDFVTYGSFNNFAKVNDEVLKAWRSILAENPTAKLVIKNKICSVPDGCEIVLSRLRRLNFPLDRIELRPYSRDYLKQYREIDVALDTFPYNGGLTTCEALFMNVPVISLAGNSHGSKFGETILTAAGFPELVAQDLNEYVKKAVALGRQKDSLRKYHGELREKILRSDLMNGRKYLRALEKIYREAWKLKWNA